MDKFDFLGIVSDIFAECKTNEEIESRKKEMILLLQQQSELSEQYLRLGILN